MKNTGVFLTLYKIAESQKEISTKKDVGMKRVVFFNFFFSFKSNVLLAQGLFVNITRFCFPQEKLESIN